jgi:DNA-binding MarR family transcriptional regulator
MEAEASSTIARQRSDEDLLAAIEHAATLVHERVNTAVGSERGWVDRVRSGLCALLELFDERPEVARLCVVQALAGPPQVLARRAEVLEQLAWIIDEGRKDARRQPPPLTAVGVVSGALGVIYARLLDEDAGALTELLNPLMSFIVMPYLGRAAARIELHRPLGVLAATAGLNSTSRPSKHDCRTRLTPRTKRVLGAIAARPGLSNSELGMRAGVADQAQISRLLARLARHGLIETRPRVVTHSWRLTAEGHELVTSASING